MLYLRNRGPAEAPACVTCSKSRPDVLPYNSGRETAFTAPALPACTPDQPAI
ncbi:hypothetical protein [Deinococcus sp. Arct2-2]|uniref:hypothetical protein n=1 Tax=Deinococcus sp. Arct2-2 TaxID=2568653 RepID=UPI001454CA1D|nr:hypothetical protein [Deinococcus sp. Arct2-2]